MQDIQTGRPVAIFSSEPQKPLEYFKEIIKYRFLIWAFAAQELKVIYAQTYLGLLWSIIKPMFTLVIFTIIFRFFLRVPTTKPYYLFAFAGMMAWNFFSQITLYGSVAIIQKQYLIHKMHFPKILLIVSKIVVASVEFGISMVIFFILMAFDRVGLGYSIIALPLFIFINIVCAFAIAIWINSLTVRFRDLNQLVPSIIGIAIWLTPVFYPTTIIPHGYEFFVYANPMAGVIKGYRFALLGEPFPEYQYWISICVTFIVAISGVFYFNRVEDRIMNYS
jgi:lipopolysaccharide transport system permease protein